MNAMEECPRFNTCEVNNCPLHPEYPDLGMIHGKDKCTMRKSVRVRIGAPHLYLPLRGMTPREYAQTKREELPTA